MLKEKNADIKVSNLKYTIVICLKLYKERVDNVRMIKCPCCGFFTISEDETQDIIIDICEVCGWQYDVTGQDPKYLNIAIGSNHVSLIEAQKNYRTYKVSDKRLLGSNWLRDPLPEELPENNM